MIVVPAFQANLAGELGIRAGRPLHCGRIPQTNHASRFMHRLTCLSFTILGGVLFATLLPSAEPSATQKTARQLFNEGNFLDAY
jgi:hypothetical protein